MKRVFSIVLLIALSYLSYGAEQKLRVAVPDDSPAAYRDEAGRYKGIYIDIIKQFCSEENLVIDYYFGSLESCVSELDKGRVDIIAGIPKGSYWHLAYTKESMAADWAIFYSREKREVKTIFDMTNRNIGYADNDYFADITIDDMKKYGVIANYKAFKTPSEAAEALKEKKIDYILGSRLRYLQDKEYLHFVRNGMEYNPQELPLAAASSKNKRLILLLDDFVREMKTEPGSSYNKLIEEIYNGEKKINTDYREIFRIITVFVMVFLFLSMLILIIYITKKYVAMKKEYKTCDIKTHKIEDKFYEFIDFYQKVIDAIPEPVYYTDTVGKCIGVNTAFIKMYDKKKEEIIGKKIHEVFDINDQNFVENQMKLLSDGGVRNYEISNFVTPRGKFSLKVHEETIYSPTGEIEGISGFLEDITEYKNREHDYEKITKEMDVYLDLFEDIFIAVNNDGEIEYANRSAAELFEYTKEEMVGKNWFDNFMPAFIGGNMKNAFSDLDNPDLEPEEYFEIPVLTKGGTEKKVGWKNRLIREAGKITLLTCGKDITERSAQEKGISDAKLFLKAVLDVIPYSIAILDETGKVIVVNKEWRALAHDIMYKNFGVGVNYIERLENLEDPYFTSAGEIAFGLKELLNKKKNKFLIEYDYDGKAKIRIRGIAFETDSKTRIAVIQENITGGNKLF